MEQNVLSILQDAGIQVDLDSLKNPTEQFMVDLMMKYLKLFYFDSETIAKPTWEQLECISYNESAAAEAIKALNLYASLSNICEQIFLEDFTLDDLTSPAGCKKTCKRIKVLFNFLLYVRNKKMENEPLLEELANEYKKIQEYIIQTEELTLKTGAAIHDREVKLEKKEQLEKEIAELKLLIEEDEKKSNDFKNRVNKIISKKEIAVTECNALKMKAQELFKVTNDLECKVVTSPEEYVSQSKELKKKLDEYKEERQIINESINLKKKQIETNDTANARIKEFTGACKLEEIEQKLKQTTAEINSSEIQIDQLRNEISSFNCKSRGSKGDPDVETIMQKKLSQLHNLKAKEQGKLDSLKVELNNIQAKHWQMKQEVEEENNKILETERQYAEQLKIFNDLYRNEIEQVKTLRKNVTGCFSQK